MFKKPTSLYKWIQIYKHNAFSLEKFENSRLLVMYSMSAYIYAWDPVGNTEHC